MKITNYSITFHTEKLKECVDFYLKYSGPKSLSTPVGTSPSVWEAMKTLLYSERELGEKYKSEIK